MKAIKIGIVEDELIIADSIIITLENLGYETTEPCMTYTDALEMVERDSPDLVLLDIQLAGKKTGIDVAEVLNRDYNIPFIFLTSNADAKTIEEAKIVNPYAYLVKPFNKDDLFTAIEIAISNFESKRENPPTETNSKLKDVLFVKNKDRFHAIKYVDVLYVKSDHVYVEIHTATDSFLVRSTFEKFVQKLPSTSFLQTHRRYVVNLEHLKEIQHDMVLIQSHEIPLSKSYRAELIKTIDLF